jgi:hypothetical protein
MKRQYEDAAVKQAADKHIVNKVGRMFEEIDKRNLND